MDLQNLLYSFLSLLFSFLCYIYHKWWVKDKKERRVGFDAYDKTARVKDWVMIILFLIISLIFFLQAIRLIK